MVWMMLDDIYSKDRPKVPTISCRCFGSWFVKKTVIRTPKNLLKLLKWIKHLYPIISENHWNQRPQKSLEIFQTSYKVDYSRYRKLIFLMRPPLMFGNPVSPC